MKHTLSITLALLGACTQHQDLQATVDAGRDSNGSGAGSDAAQASGYQGFINLQTLTSTGPSGPSGVAVAIYFMPATPGGVFCYAGTPHGDCCVFGGGALPPAVSAGELMIKNNTSGESGTTKWSPALQAYDGLSTFETWTTGDSLTVTGAGDVVAAFAASATFPSPIVNLVTPSPVSIAAGWDVQWKPAGATTVEVYLSTETGPGQIACRAPDNAGHLRFPPELLNGVISPGAGSVIVERKNLGLGDTNPAIWFEPEMSDGGAVTVVP